MACISKKKFLKLWPVDTSNQMAKEGKALGDQVDASTKYLSENKDYSGVGCFFPNYVGYVGEGNDELRVLNSQFKMR